MKHQMKHQDPKLPDIVSKNLNALSESEKKRDSERPWHLRLTSPALSFFGAK